MKIAGVVVLYNPQKDVLKNIDSYLSDIDHLYVVDNSVENHQFMFNDSRITYIPLMENKGIAYALNAGAKYALEESFKYLLTMDQDSSFEEHGVRRMIDFIERDNEKSTVGIYSPFHKTAISGEIPIEEVSSPLVVMTSGNIINLSIYEKINGFKDWMFIDCVDFDFGLNLRTNGYTIKQLNHIILHHELGDYEIKKFFNKKVFCDNHSALRRYYIVRNSFYLYDMYHDQFPDYCNAVIKEVKNSFFYATIFEKNGFKKLIYMIRGYKDYKKGKVGK